MTRASQHTLEYVIVGEAFSLMLHAELINVPSRSDDGNRGEGAEGREEEKNQVN